MNVKAMVQAVAGENLDLASRDELIRAIEMADTAANSSGALIDTLRALHDRGPLWDGDVPSKSGRDALLLDGYVAKVLVNGEQGFNACTYKGAALLRAIEAR